MRYNNINFWCISFVSSEFFKHVQKTLKSCTLGNDLFYYNLSSEARKNTFRGLKTTQNCLFSSHLFFRHSWTIALGPFCISGVFSNSHRSSPSPHATSNVGRVYPEFFSEFQLCIGWGKGGTARKFRKGCTIL